MRPGLLLRVAFSLALVSGGAALAAEPDPGEALFRQGRAAMAAGDLANAHEKLTASLALSRRPSTLFSLAQCEERRGHPASALQRWREGFGMIDASDARRQAAAERVVDLEKKVARLWIQLDGAPAGASVRLDGADLALASLAGPTLVDPGNHTVVLVAPGRADRTENLVLGEGETKVLTLTPPPPAVAPDAMRPSAVSPPVAAPPASTPATAAPPGSSPPPGRGVQRPLGIALGTLGLATVGIGVGFGIHALVRDATAHDLCKSDTTCPPGPGLDASRDASTSAKVSDGLLAGGLALAGVGLVVALTAKPGAEARAALSIGPRKIGVRVGF